MKTEELLTLGLSREQASHVLAINGRDIERTKKAGEEQREELERLKKEYELSREKLAQYQKIDTDRLKQEACEWKEKAQLAEKKARDAAEHRTLREEARRLYRENGARSDELLDALVDWESVRVSDGRVEGLSEQVDALKKEYGYLFEDGELPRFSTSLGETAKEDGSAIRAAMGIG